MKQKNITYRDGISKLADRLLNPDSNFNSGELGFEIGNFYDFVRDIWSQGYEYPEHFSLWHVELLCRELEESINNGKNYVAVLPRGHYKSTLLGHAFSVWRLLSSDRDCQVSYLSYSETMARYHIQKIKEAIRNNHYLKGALRDRATGSDYTFRCTMGNKYIEILSNGIFSFQRGMHVNGALVADDLLRDPENPLNVVSLEKVESIFYSNAMYIPSPGVPVVVVGTPMSPHDLLAKLQKDDTFVSRVLPIYYPVPDIPILAPEIRDKDWLEKESKARPIQFKTEFMLEPYSGAISFLNDDDICNVENDNLISLNPYINHYKDIYDSDYTVAGLDIGKKRSPSNLVIFSSKKNEYKMIQVNVEFMDGWDYTKQVDFINDVTENFGIDRGYFDNTRAELEDRFLHPNWVPQKLTLTYKRKLAQIFEHFIKNNLIELIPDERQRALIVSVNNELKAPETALGHGDSFWAISLACMAYHEANRFGIQMLGSINEFVEISEDREFFSRRKSDYEFDEGCHMCGTLDNIKSNNNLCIACYFNQMLKQDKNMIWTPIQLYTNNNYEERYE